MLLPNPSHRVCPSGGDHHRYKGDLVFVVHSNITIPCFCPILLVFSICDRCGFSIIPLPVLSGVPRCVLSRVAVLSGVAVFSCHLGSLSSVSMLFCSLFSNVGVSSSSCDTPGCPYSLKYLRFLTYVLPFASTS